ncbi:MULTISPECIES: ABC transporter permease [unclassified Acinetobacter]|jgi:sulfonate transport system permease protein|uniref:ABC transporter permease n=1 Tax=unclassified Acinetobacter TaxID=196816 RepID=UPI0015D42BB9|nr:MULTISPECIES: ABC transporter permease [unclassified Acinetobacter]QQN39553.1 ABC transporter permease [Acinetobacter sp. CS-2]
MAELILEEHKSSSVETTRPKNNRFWRPNSLHVQALILPVAFLVLWSIASYFDWVNPKLIPSPWDVGVTAVETLSQAQFWQGVAASLSRNFSGYAIGASLGVAFGVLLGTSHFAQWFLAPSFHVLRQVSLFAWLPLISTFLGYGNFAKLLFIGLSVFYPVALHSLEGVRNISDKYREVAQVYQFPKSYTYRKLIFPGASPQIFVGLQLGLIFAWLATIGSEFLLANYGVGLGNLVIRGREQFNVPLILLGMLIIGAVGLVLNRILQHIEKRVLVWQK